MSKPADAEVADFDEDVDLSAFEPVGAEEDVYGAAALGGSSRSAGQPGQYRVQAPGELALGHRLGHVPVEAAVRGHSSAGTNAKRSRRWATRVVLAGQRQGAVGLGDVERDRPMMYTMSTEQARAGASPVSPRPRRRRSPLPDRKCRRAVHGGGHQQRRDAGW